MAKPKKSTKKRATLKKKKSAAGLKSTKLEEKVKRLSDKLRLFMDSDSDGLSDEQEKLYNTNPNNPDTDGDGLSDYEEIKVYQTDPNNPDTDGDGIEDGEEVRSGTNPKGRGRLKNLFFSYSGNKYSPGLLKYRRLALYGASAVAIKLLLLVFVASIPLSAWVTPNISGEQAKKIILLTNEIRESLGVELLVESETLSQAAYNKVQDMLTEQYFAHTSSKKKGLGYWLRTSDYAYASAGENLAMGFGSASDVVNAWMQSKTHYANMIDPEFDEMGVGFISGDFKGYDTTLVAQFFGNKASTIPKKHEIQLQNVETDNLDSNKKVFGEKIVATPALQLPQIMYPNSGYETADTLLKLEILAPEAETVNIYQEDELVIEIKGQGQSTFETEIDLVGGKNTIRLKSIRGDEIAISGAYIFFLDQTAPQVDTKASKLFITDSNNRDQRIVRAEVYVSDDTVKASVFLSNHEIELNRDVNNDNKWTGSIILFNSENKDIFNPIVLPSLTVEDEFGNTATVDIAWENITPVKASLIQQYFFAKNNKSGLGSVVFSFTTIVYQIMLGFIIFTLLLNIFVKIRKQNPRIILPSLAMVVLLIILIII